jgi:hypothetical protein
MTPHMRDRFEVKKDTPKDEDAEEEPCIGSAVIGIWESFLSVQSSGSSVSRSFGKSSSFDKSRSGQHLPVFERLSQGEHLDAHRRLPHINSTRYRKTVWVAPTVDSRSAAGRRCF